MPPMVSIKILSSGLVCPQEFLSRTILVSRWSQDPEAKTIVTQINEFPSQTCLFMAKIAQHMLQSWFHVLFKAIASQ